MLLAEEEGFPCAVGDLEGRRLFAPGELAGCRVQVD